MPTIFSVDQRKRSQGFRWCVIRDFDVVVVVATYLQAYRVATLLNQNAVLDEEKIAALQAVTIRESRREAYAQQVRRIKRYA